MSTKFSFLFILFENVRFFLTVQSLKSPIFLRLASPIFPEATLLPISETVSIKPAVKYRGHIRFKIWKKTIQNSVLRKDQDIKLFQLPQKSMKMKRINTKRVYFDERGM